MDPVHLAEFIRRQIWGEQGGYGSVPSTGAETLTEKETKSFLSEVNIGWFEDVPPWGFSTEVGNITLKIAGAHDPWTGETRVVMKIRKGEIEVVLITSDCHRSHWWKFFKKGD
jgi:hypothetical protein